MNFEEAKAILSTGVRSELRDHAFGDTEMFWTLEGEEIAGGYFGGGHASVWVNPPNTDPSHHGSFEGDEARELRKLGVTGLITRNDETGSDTYSEGSTMPGLTLEGVRYELLDIPMEGK